MCKTEHLKHLLKHRENLIGHQFSTRRLQKQWNTQCQSLQTYLEQANHSILGAAAAELMSLIYSIPAFISDHLKCCHDDMMFSNYNLLIDDLE